MLLLFTLTISLFIQTIVAQTPLKTISPCVAEYADGSRIDISSLASAKGYRWKNKAPTVPGDNHWYYYNPCKAFSLGGNTCPENAACQGDSEEKSFYDIGRQDQTVTFQANEGYVTIMYKAQNGERITGVDCYCTTEKTPTFKVTGVNPSSKATYYRMRMDSLCCCPGGCKASDNGGGGSGDGLSGGSILLIVFFVSVFVYLISGIVFAAVFKKDQTDKTKFIPNLEFWKELPSYVKDGVKFSYSKVKGGSQAGSYQNI